MAGTHRWPALALAILAAGVPQAARADRKLTLDEALALARTKNRDLRGARERIAEARAGVEQVRAQLLPNLVAQGRYTHNYKEVDFNIGALTLPVAQLADIVRETSTDPAQQAQLQMLSQGIKDATNAAPPVVISKQEQLDGNLAATVPIIAPSTWYALSAANRSLEASEATFQVSEASVLVAVAQAYFAAAGSDELVLARQDAVKVATETFDVAKARVAAELANQVEQTRAETALIRAQQDLVEAQNTQGAAHRALATSVGVTEPIEVDRVVAVPAEPGALDQLVTAGKSGRPEIAAQKANIAAGTATERADLFRWAPTLSGFANVHVQNYTGFSGDKYAWAIGLSLDWLLYDGGVRDAQRHQVEAQRREAEVRLELLDATIADEVANARGTLDAKRKAVTAATRSVELAKETLRLVRAQYDAGTAKQLDVLTAQDGLVTAEVGLAQAHFEVALADLQLRRAAGTFPGRAAK